MQTCRMCGARLTDESELDRHNQTMHPNMGGKKGGEQEQERKPERDRPVEPID